MIPEEPDVAIIGAGPAGAAAAQGLVAAGVRNVVVLEREPEVGGIPQFCNHPSFGLREFGRLLTGQQYARRLVGHFEGATLACRTTVERIDPDLGLVLSTPDGAQIIRPKRLLLATGIRETPRSARLVSGDRPEGVFTTGALQRILHGSYRPSCRNAVVVGTELVSFSALLALRHLGIRPIGMIEEHARITARRPGDVIARLLLGVPVYTSTRLLSINAAVDDPKQLVSVTVDGPSGQRDIACNAIVFTGAFVPESSLLGREAGTLLDARTGGPAIDQNWRTRNPRIFAAGNVLRSVETAGWAFAEGKAAGRTIAANLAGALETSGTQVPVTLSGPVLYSVPSYVSLGSEIDTLRFQTRVEQPCSGRFSVRVDGDVAGRTHRGCYLPERRVLVRSRTTFPETLTSIDLSFDRYER